MNIRISFKMEQKGYSFKKLICTDEGDRIWYAKRKDGSYEIYNQDKNEWLGDIKRVRVGKFMHWKLVFTKELFEDCEEIGFTNGCLKEISKFITYLYSECSSSAKKEKKQ